MGIIRIPDEVLVRLSKLKISEDEPVWRVIVDLLAFSEAQKKPRQPPPVISKALPEKAYRDAVHAVLTRHGGEANTKQIRPEIKDAMGHLFGPADLAKHASGVPMWWNHAQHAWEHIKKSGMGYSPEHSVWALTDSPPASMPSASDSIIKPVRAAIVAVSEKSR